MRLLLGCATLATLAVILGLTWLCRRDVWRSQVDTFADAWVAEQLRPDRVEGRL